MDYIKAKADYAKSEETSKTWTSTDLWDMNKHVREREREVKWKRRRTEREKENWEFKKYWKWIMISWLQ